MLADTCQEHQGVEGQRHAPWRESPQVDTAMVCPHGSVSSAIELVTVVPESAYVAYLPFPGNWMDSGILRWSSIMSLPHLSPETDT